MTERAKRRVVLNLEKGEIETKGDSGVPHSVPLLLRAKSY